MAKWVNTSSCVTSSTLFQYPIRRLIVRFYKVSKPRDRHLELFDRREILQATQQHCHLCACQISKRCGNLNCRSHRFETSRDFTIRRLIWYWNGDQVTYLGNYLSALPTPTLVSGILSWNKLIRLSLMYGILDMYSTYSDTQWRLHVSLNGGRVTHK